MRAAVAGLKPVRSLRPRGMPVRSLALAATAAGANLPCGAWREHTDKFSLQWVLAVHATVPFVAMLRKAVLMPQWAILLTIAASVAGQQAGAQLERRRLAAGGCRAAAPAAAAAGRAPPPVAAC
jgi:acetaldehyde dehydrogenase (acetylating)